MKLSELEQKRLAKVSASARQTINDLNIKADRLYARGNDESRTRANVLYKESDRLYAEQVLNRRFN